MTTLNPADKRNMHWVVPGICLVLCALTWVVFGQTLSHQFVNYDDGTYVYANPAVRSGFSAHAVAWAFTHVHSQNWHPLTTISHMLDCTLYGLRPGGHHFTNVLLHTVAVLLLFFVLWQMTGNVWRSAFVAAIFAIHPLRAESVAWIAERKDLLSGIFFMLTLGAYTRYARTASSGDYIATCVLFALGLMAKPMLVTLPVVLWLLDYWPLNRCRISEVSGQRSEVGAQRAGQRPGWSRRALAPDAAARTGLLLEKLPLFALSAASCVATFLAQKQAIGSVDQLPLAWRLSNAVTSYFTYVWQMLWPVRLAVFYPHPENQLSGWQIILAAAFVLAVTLVAVLLRKRHPYIITGWLWYLIMLLPVIGIFQVGLQGHADRYTYLPQIGLYILVAWTVSEFVGARRRGRFVALGAISAVIIVALSASAWSQTKHWKNSETLWTHTLEVTSNNDVAHAGLGGILFGNGKVDEAISHFREAIRNRPGNAEAHSNLARALQSKGNTVDAIAHWQKSLELQPEDVQTRDTLGVALVQQGRLGDAVAQWQESVRFNPDDGNALSDLAWVWATAPEPSMRNGPKAVEFAERALQLSNQTNPTVFRTLAAAYAESGRFSDAVATAKRGLQLALDQKNASLAEELRGNVGLYQSGSPLRDRSLANAAP